MLNKRDLFRHGLTGMAGLGLCAAFPRALLAQGAEFAKRPPLVPLEAEPDRIYDIGVCLRPFRAAGPRLEVESVGAKRVIHHYGHGGSGWSLSWGSAQMAVPLALTDGQTDIAVVGAGAIGLTTAITAQRMGAKVTIYTKDRFPDVKSAKATGSWTPSSRIAMAEQSGPDFAKRWERMARASFATHQSWLGAAGMPVEWQDRYFLHDVPPADGPVSEVATARASHSRHFVELDHLTNDLLPRAEGLPAGTHPFPVPHVTRSMSLTFNVADLCRHLEEDFLAAGGRFHIATFHEPSDFGRIKENTIINCTGYGARALFRDESVVPIRGQIAWLMPQAGFNYGVRYASKGLSILGRRDGIVVQHVGVDDFYGYNDTNETPDVATARADVELAASLFRPRHASAD